MSTSDTALRATGLTLGYGQHAVLTGVSFEAHCGEVWCCIGSNGSGKTTLFRAILGLLRPLAGELWFHPELSRRERVAFVPQRCDPNPSLPITVREFIELGLVGTSVRSREYALRISEALGKVGLSSMVRRDYWTLSGGQRQRVLLARALVRRPGLLVLDEPTNGLDRCSEEDLLASLMEVNRADRLTVLLATHDLELAARHATHAALFFSGGVQAGPASETLRAEPLSRTFGRKVSVLLPVEERA